MLVTPVLLQIFHYHKWHEIKRQQQSCCKRQQSAKVDNSAIIQDNLDITASPSLGFSRQEHWSVEPLPSP